MKKQKHPAVNTLNLVLAITGGWALVNFFLLVKFGKVESFLLVNNYHNRILDDIFIPTTFLGDGVFTIILVAILLIFSKWRRLAIVTLAGYLVSGALAQILKHTFSSPRPRAIIDGSIYTHFLKGITVTGFDSFPSGHATSIFTLATILSMYFMQKRLTVLFVFIAILVAYSRVYLGHHFLQDVITGGVLGVLIGTIASQYLFPPERLVLENSVR